MMLPFSLDHYRERRAALAQLMVANSAALLPANPEQIRSRDTEFPFRQDSDLLYLSGFGEPESALLLVKEGDGSHQSFLLCRDKDPVAEVWQGRRLGPQAAVDALGLDGAWGWGDRSERLRELLNGRAAVYYAQGHLSGCDSLLFDTLAALRGAPKKGWRAPPVIHDSRPLLADLRLIKSNEELAVMARAAQISADAHNRAMAVCRPGQFEYQLEAEILHQFASHGARFAAYNSIVGGGINACILHYTENSEPLNDGELVLIDAGAELHGYAADITRTFPINGRFSLAQRQLYELVLSAQQAAMLAIRPGGTIEAAGKAAVQVLTEGLVALGILAGEVEALIATEAYKPYFMHGIGHWLGLDVHDVGDYKPGGQLRPLLPGMVLTIEPGLYIAPDAPVAEQWRGIGIRIEDNLVVTSGGHEVLTAAAVKTVAEIETLMATARS